MSIYKGVILNEIINLMKSHNISIDDIKRIQEYNKPKNESDTSQTINLTYYEHDSHCRICGVYRCGRCL